MTVTTPHSGASRRNLPHAPFLQAIRGEQPSRRPVWFMRQAGRSLPEYRALRANVAMLDSCFQPELAAEITLQPVRRHDVDAAIFFSDIVVPLKAAGIPIDIVPGRGPVVDMPVADRAAIDALPSLAPEQLAPIHEAVRLTLDGLTDTQVLIGFAGAPFTVASYLIEGGPTKTHQRTKALMHGDPESWHSLMRTLTDYIITFLKVQINAGVDAIQLFDSWAGFLPDRDYRTFVAPYSQEIFAAVAAAAPGLPRIHFGVTTGELLGSMALTGPDVMGVDWRVDMAAAAQRINAALGEEVHSSLRQAAGTDSVGADGSASDAALLGSSAHQPGDIVLQGNLDPALLAAGPTIIDREINHLVRTTDELIATGQIRGHIVNLGHGVLPDTRAEDITRAVATIHSV